MRGKNKEQFVKLGDSKMCSREDVAQERVAQRRGCYYQTIATTICMGIVDTLFFYEDNFVFVGKYIQAYIHWLRRKTICPEILI